MDNDLKLKKIATSLYRSLRFKIEYGNKVILNEDASELIAKYIKSNKPFMIARFGAVEMRCIDQFLKGKQYNNKIKHMIKVNAGVFPNDKETMDKFSEFYLECSKNIDVLSLWQVKGEANVVRKYCYKSSYINLIGLEPYYFNNPWSKELKDKRVLIIHPFKETILKQYNNKEKIFNNKDVLPEFKSLEVIKAVQSNAGENVSFKSWFEAYEYMCKEIDKKEFDIAIIGAGAYGLPLASYIKGIGKQAIQMAGATQILFGIKGKRWDDNKCISRLYNEHWIRPSEQETPKNAGEVEGGSYW